jgi:hypothetical protein
VSGIELLDGVAVLFFGCRLGSAGEAPVTMKNEAHMALTTLGDLSQANDSNAM